MTFDLRLRLHNAAGVRGRVLQTLTRTLAGTESTEAKLTFTMSAAAVEPPQLPFIVGVEYTYDGKSWKAPRNNLFMFDEDSRDEADEAQAVTFSGQPYVTWLMERARLYPLASATMNGDRVWGTPSSAGRVLATMISEAKARGWAPNLTYQFAAGYDSNGVAWLDSDKVEQSYKPLVAISSALSFAVEQGLCDWWTEGMELKLLRPGTGTARPDVVLGGSRMNRVPTSRSFADVFTHLTVVGEYADHLLHLTNTGASTAFGRLESTMTQSGVGLDTTMTRMAQPFMQDSRAVKSELSYEWTPLDDDMPRLWENFQVGDNVTCITRDGRKSLRVVGFVVTVDGDTPTMRVVTGARRFTRSAQIAKRLGSVAVAGKVGGSGNALPNAVTAVSTTPASVTGVSAATNTVTWTSDGTPVAVVTLGWEQVTTAVDGSGLDIAEYEVWWRTGDGQLQRLTATTTLSVTTRAWTPGEQVLVRVRARSVGGKWGAFSAEMSVTPAVDTTPPARPSTPTATARLGQIIVSWDGLTSTGAPQPVDFSHADVLMATSAAGADVVVGQIVPSGTFVAPEQPYNEQRWFSVIAVDTTGNRSTESARVTVTTKPLVDTDLIGRVIDGANVKLDAITNELIAANAVGTTEISDDAITTPKIRAGAVTADELAALSVTAGKIAALAVTAEKIAALAVTAEKIAANAITADKIAAGAVTAVKVDANAITGEKIAADAIDGKTITGALVRTAASGARTEMTPSGLRTVNVAGQDQVRIGFGVATGMEVRDPTSGNLVPLAEHVFGTYSRITNGGVNVPWPTSENTWGPAHAGGLEPGTFSTSTGRLLVIFGLDAPQGSQQNYSLRMMCQVFRATGGSTLANTRYATVSGLYGASNFDILTGLPVNTPLAVQFATQAMKFFGSTGPAQALDRRIVVIPI